MQVSKSSIYSTCCVMRHFSGLFHARKCVHVKPVHLQFCDDCSTSPCFAKIKFTSSEGYRRNKCLCFVPAASYRRGYDTLSPWKSSTCTEHSRWTRFAHFRPQPDVALERKRSSGVRPFSDNALVRLRRPIVYHRIRDTIRCWPSLEGQFRLSRCDLPE